MQETALWIFGAYCIGTLVGFLLNRKSKQMAFLLGVEITIDSLIDKGYIRTQKTADGETRLLKINE